MTSTHTQPPTQEAKAKAEAEAQCAADAAAAAAKQQQQQAQQQQQQQPHTPSAGVGTTAAASLPAAGGDCKAAPGALEWERTLAEKLRAAEDTVRDLMTKPVLKPQRRQIEKRVTLIVSQIAGTQQQVGCCRVGFGWVGVWVWVWV